MILQALYDYYYRCGNLPRKGMELKEIGFIIVLDKEGNFLRFEDRRINKQQAQRFLVKKHVNRTSALVANYLYDNSGYVLGFSDKGTVLAQYQVFKNQISLIKEKFPDNQDIETVHKFYQQDQQDIIKQVQLDPLWHEIEKNLNKKFSVFSFLVCLFSTFISIGLSIYCFISPNMRSFTSLLSKVSDILQVPLL